MQELMIPLPILAIIFTTVAILLCISRTRRRIFVYRSFSHFWSRCSGNPYDLTDSQYFGYNRWGYNVSIKETHPSTFNSSIPSLFHTYGIFRRDVTPAQNTLLPDTVYFSYICSITYLFSKRDKTINTRR